MGQKPRDAPLDYDLMLSLTGYYEEGAEVYRIPKRTYLQRQNWIYLFPKKGATMDDSTPIPVQNWDNSVKCPKCEGDDEDLKMVWRVATNEQSTVNGQKYELPDGFEHLFCQCLCCSYEWLMQTADADERAEAAKQAAEEENDKAGDEEEEEDKPAISAKGHGSRVVKGGP